MARPPKGWLTGLCNQRKNNLNCGLRSRESLVLCRRLSEETTGPRPEREECEGPTVGENWSSWLYIPGFTASSTQLSYAGAKLCGLPKSTEGLRQAVAKALASDEDN